MTDSKGSEIIDMLSLLCSSDGGVRRNSSAAFISLSFTHPEIIIDKINEIKLVLISLCATSTPCWATVSSIMFVISNAINLHPISLRTKLPDFIEISRIITKAAFNQNNNVERFQPILSYYSQSIIKNYNSSFQVTKEIILSISEHCLLGFLPYSSLIQLLVEKFQQVVIIAKEMGNDDLMKLAKPLSCTENMIIKFYLTLWVNLMASLMLNPFAVEAIRTQALKLISLSKNYEDAKILVNISKASPKEKAALNKDIKKYAERSLSKLKSAQEAHTKAEVTTFKKEVPKAGMSTRFELHITEVSILLQKSIPKKLKSKKWLECLELRLVEEASILFWKKKNHYKATALQCSDIDNISLIQQSKSDCDKENVIMIQTISTKHYIFISFQNYELATQWLNLIKQAKFS